MILKETIVWENVNVRKTKMPTYIENYCKSYNVLVTDVVYEENKVTFIAYTKLKYEDIVVRLIREKYSESEELALNRKFNMYGISQEYIEFNNYVESCIAQAREFVAERVSIFGK